MDEVSVKSVIYMHGVIPIGGAYMVAGDRIRHLEHDVSADEMSEEWKKIGSFADCDIVARGNLRRLVDQDGTIVIEFEVKD